MQVFHDKICAVKLHVELRNHLEALAVLSVFGVFDEVPDIGAILRKPHHGAAVVSVTQVQKLLKGGRRCQQNAGVGTLSVVSHVIVFEVKFPLRFFLFVRRIPAVGNQRFHMKRNRNLLIIIGTTQPVHRD